MVIIGHFAFLFCLIYNLKYSQVVGHLNVTAVTI